MAGMARRMVEERRAPFVVRTTSAACDEGQRGHNACPPLTSNHDLPKGYDIEEQWWGLASHSLASKKAPRCTYGPIWRGLGPTLPPSWLRVRGTLVSRVLVPSGRCSGCGLVAALRHAYGDPPLWGLTLVTPSRLRYDGYGEENGGGPEHPLRLRHPSSVLQEEQEGHNACLAPLSMTSQGYDMSAGGD